MDASYPLRTIRVPSEYIDLFTNENLKSCPKVAIPPDIIQDEYTIFGKTYEPNQVLLRSLESQNIERLDSMAGPKTVAIKTEKSDVSTRSIGQKRRPLNPSQYKAELKKLNHSILISYLELLDVLVKAPSASADSSSSGKSLRDQKLDDLEVLFKNMHHLINELRPHQARDSLICLMEIQRRERVELASKFRRHLEHCVDVLHSCIKSIDSASDAAASSASSHKRALRDEITQMMATASRLGKSLEQQQQQPPPPPQLQTVTTKNSGGGGGENTDRPTPYSKQNGYHRHHSDNHNDNDVDATVTTAAALNHDTNHYQKEHETRPCDFRDQILCDFIDECLIKEF